MGTLKNKATVKLDSNLSKVADALPNLLAMVMERETLQTERLARQWAPVDTGMLRNSSTSSIQRGNPTIGEVTFHAFYAAYVNFGTGSRGASSSVPDRPDNVRYTMGFGGMSAMPYLSLAANKVTKELTRWAKYVGDAIEQAARVGGMGA
jgi:hypothetical protein